uniref:TatD related DNase n=1 Tax=Phytophthora capsici TaxID=4784 RepID=A0A075M388_PHYCP|nr:TatD related DNase [Phytophthora capsici]|eukprot:jgi/Phyca11/103573/e_gw1.8.74.1
MALKMIDIGANLTDPVFTGLYRGKQKHESDFTAILARAKAFGVDKIIVTGGNLEESRKALHLAQQHEGDGFPQLFSTVGVHPTRCSEFAADGNNPDAYFAQLLAICEQGKSEGKVVAVGECGLDYDRLEFCDKATQLKYFEKQFELAEQTKLPLFLHNRNTGGDFYEMISKNRSRFSNGVVHSFTGEKEEMLKLVELGLYIGVNGCSLKTAENLECVKAIPLDRLMIETDAPWCDIRATHAGHGFVKTTWQSKKAEKYSPDCLVKGRNEPCTLIQVLEIISAVRGEPQEEVAACVLENTQRVFFSE